MATRRRASRNSITGTITDLQRRVRYLQTLPAPSKLANQVVRRVNIQPRAVDSDQLALRAVVNDSVEDKAIEERNLGDLAVSNRTIADNAITRLKILDGEVVDGKLGTDSVNTANIKNSNITTAKLQNAAVEESKIASSAVTNSKIANSAVSTAKIADSNVTTSKIADSNVTTGKLADSAVTNAKIGGGAVSSAKIADGAVTESKIANGAVTSNKIGTAAVTSIKIGTGAVNTNQLANLSVNASKITNNAIDSPQKITTATQRLILQNNTTDSSSISKGSASGLLIFSANFGGQGFQIARGNHRHTVLGATTSTPVDSSGRFKKDIADYEFPEPERLLQLTLKKFKYKKALPHKDFNKEWFYGYIAEEVQALGLSEFAVFDKKGRVAGLDYGLISVFIVELLKKQQAEIEELKNRSA